MVVLFDLLAESEKPLTLKQLSLDAGLASSTTFRILSNLKKHGLIIQDSRNNYQLGRRFLHYSKKIQQPEDVHEQIKPIMEELHELTQETINLSIRDGDELVYIERKLSSQMLRANISIGKRTPLYATAVGKLILGAMSTPEREIYLQNANLEAFTSKTIIAKEIITEQSIAAYNSGFAFEYEEAELGLGCVGTIFNFQHQTYGLSISAPVERLKSEWGTLLKNTCVNLFAI